jgi:hypothetical protein
VELPFTADQFFHVMRQYNQAVWPAQLGLNLLALIAVGLLAWRRPASDRWISSVLALLWAWTGIVYQLIYFTAINGAAYAFAALCLAGAIVFLWAGLIKQQLVFASHVAGRRIAGVLLVIFAMVVYPLLSVLAGHGYPDMPTFGLPCPTTIFTVGVLCFLKPPYPRYVLLAPVLWAAIGSQAAFLLGVYQDLGLLLAGAIGVVLWLRPGTAHGRTA